MINDRFKTVLQYLLPQHALSRLAGSVSNCRIRWFKNWLIQDFIKRYGVDMKDALEPNPQNYINFNHFFTRELRSDARPMTTDETAIVSPVDGTVSQIGNIDANTILQAKGFNYTVESLLGGSKERAVDFYNGRFVTLYLAPKDYHRVHMPLSGQLREMIYVPGRLFSVNQTTTEHVPNLFARNERVVCIFDTQIGQMAIVLVGAMLVASIRTAWSDHQRPIYLTRGAEMGHFQLGSTVIVLFGPNKMEWTADLQAEKPVFLRQMIGKSSAS